MMVKKGLKVSRCIANSTDNGRMMSKFKYFTPLKFMNGFVFLEKKGGLMQHQRVVVVVFPQAPFRATNVPGQASAGIIQLRNCTMAS